MVTEPHPPSNDVLIGGKYRLGEVLGAGGVGTVYRATHIWTEREVAIKVLDPALPHDDYFRRAFLREARAAAALHHRHVVDVLDMGGVEEGRMYLVMELLDGPTLRDELNDRVVLPAADTFDVLLPVMDALDAAHARGILHRDVKPENILLSWDGSPEMVPKLLDFGVAQLTEGLRGDRGEDDPWITGTPAYMSPERSLGEHEKIGPHTDVWGVAVVWYECLTGAPPFDGESPAEVLNNVCSADVSFEGLPDAHVRVLREALQRDPEARTQTIADLKASILQAGIRPADPSERGEGRSSRPSAPLRTEVQPTLHGLSPVWVRPMPAATPPQTHEPTVEVSPEPQPAAEVWTASKESADEEAPPLPTRGRFGLPVLLAVLGFGAFLFLADSFDVERRAGPSEDVRPELSQPIALPIREEVREDAAAEAGPPEVPVVAPPSATSVADALREDAVVEAAPSKPPAPAPSSPSAAPDEARNEVAAQAAPPGSSVLPKSSTLVVPPAPPDAAPPAPEPTVLETDKGVPDAIAAPQPPDGVPEALARLESEPPALEEAEVAAVPSKPKSARPTGSRRPVPPKRAEAPSEPDPSASETPDPPAVAPAPPRRAKRARRARSRRSSPPRLVTEW
ncbi:MAG: serine/threonine-protein kinase [Myxococcota bacterium]